MVTAAVFLSAFTVPKTAENRYKNLAIWLYFDGICHLTLEGSFLAMSTFGRTVNSSTGFFAYLWQEYVSRSLNWMPSHRLRAHRDLSLFSTQAKADLRWGWSDPNVVSLEILTVLGESLIAILKSSDDPWSNHSVLPPPFAFEGAGPIALYCAYLLSQGKFGQYHFWAILLSTAEIYGGFMTFSPWVNQLIKERERERDESWRQPDRSTSPIPSAQHSNDDNARLARDRHWCTAISLFPTSCLSANGSQEWSTSTVPTSSTYTFISMVWTGSGSSSLFTCYTTPMERSFKVSRSPRERRANRRLSSLPFPHFPAFIVFLIRSPAIN